MTKNERQSNAIARQLAKAIQRLERFDGDPETILDDADIHASRMSQAVRDTLTVIRNHYINQNDR